MEEAAAAVVQEEIEVVKQLEAGPTEAELRRRKLVEIDEEVQEERADRLRRMALRELSRALPCNKQINRKEKLGELRTWIRKLLKSDDMRIQDRVQNELKLSVGRLLLMDGQKVDYHDYLNRNNDEDSDDGYSDHSDEDVSDDEDDYDHGSVIDVKQEKKDIAIKGNNKVEKLKEAIIEFSDDEDDDEDVEDDHDTVDNNDDKENKDDSSQLSHSHEEPTQVQESFDNLEEPDAPIRNGISEELRRKFMFPTSLDMQENTRRHTSMDLFKANPLLARRPLNPHQALKMSLYKKVLVAGQENLCKSMNILTSQLDLYQDIVDKCRSFIEIIRDREDRLQRRQQRKDEEDRERRRVQFLEQAYDDDEEFDEDGIDESGPKMTEEQKQKILADFQNWPDEENDNDDNNDDDGDEHEDEDDEEQKRLKNKINDKKLTEKLLKKIKKASGESEVTNKAVKAVADEDEDEASDDNASSADESSASSDEDGDDDDDSDNSTTAVDTDMITDSDKPSENKTSKSLRKLSKKSKIIVTEDDNADEDVDEHTDSKISSAVSTSALISKPNSITRDEESGPVVRRTYGRPSASQRISMDSDDDNDDENDVSAAPRDRSIDEEQTAPQISMNNTDLDSDQRMTATQGPGDQEDDDGQQTQPQQDNDNDDDADNEEENDTVKVAPKLKKPKSSAFRKMVEEEERRSKVEKLNRNRMLEDEAEEEEEEGVQAGLGDFGFGVSRARDDDEADALRIRKGDFDHIVDDVSDDEGDDEAGDQARLELERRDDLERTKAVINAVTEGHASRDKRTRSKFTFDKLVSGRDEDELMRGQGNRNEDGDGPNEDEFDEEEMLQRGLQARAERENFARNSIALDSDDDEMYSSDEDDENLDEELDEATLKKREEDQKVRQEQRRKEYLQMRMFNKQDKIRRTFRRIQHSGENLMNPELLLSRPSDLLGLNNTDDYSHIEGSMSMNINPTPVATQEMSERTMSGPLLDITNISNNTSNAAETLKRRTSMIPKRVASTDVTRSRSRPPSGLKTITANSNSVSNMTGGNSRSGLPIRATSLYCGSLNTGELDAGYGMGMAVTAANSRRFISRQNSSDNTSHGNGSNLFSHVTGVKRTMSESAMNGTGGASNGGSSFHKKRNSSFVTAVSASQFVFTNANTNASTNHVDDTQSYLDANSRGGADSNYGASKLPSNSHSRGEFSKPTNISSSLFAKLNSASTRPGGLKRKPSFAQ